ncbi:hypothetical protein CAL12_04990 [Bordetella genomosp. 8]|uniref:FAD-binding PCMH-type domain-containing protein n=1 Tax=Bordetella genomosp. 8 TaxID=1416806 RepID=A0A1W6YGW1_9BORD|nr:hypothetical protein [Bordetella genomosp. 8]ARP80248.1 hypothetical protein CAL12_04990 [Bordetella genomosp. 8]
MQPSRRAFLMGRATPRTPWQVFCHSLRRVCAGELKVIQAAEAAPQARWTPVDGADVRQARLLCLEHGVQLALAGSAGAVDGRPVLWVDPAALNRLVREPGAVPRWRAGPGVTLGQLAGVGLPQFTDADPARTLAAWFADRRAAAWPTGRGDLSGVYEADVLLADGVAETLGPFGADDGRPLRSATLQQLVPALFRLASGEEARWCAEQPVWPARYRLDALLPAAPATVNLGCLLHGHEGTLAWLESLVLQAPPQGLPSVSPPAMPAASRPESLPASPTDSPTGSSPAAPEAAGAAMSLPPARARALDRRIKDSFDPAGVFPEPA